MRILIAGASGFIGSHLAEDLRRAGHEVVALSRKRGGNGIYWNPEHNELDAAKIDGFDVIVNLAGESVAERWNDKRKKQIYDSRIKGTKLLVSAMKAAQKKPSVFLCASAIGYYGERGDEILTEDSTAGNNFLAKVCIDWEAAAREAETFGVRVVNLRFGIVLSTTGGALPRMLQPFQMGAGGRLGTGKQYMSWISLDDTVAAIKFAMDNSGVSGPLNIVSPGPVTNTVFTEELGKALHKPAVMPVPTTMVHFTFGTEMADQVLLASDRVLPERLSSAGFQFKHAKLEPTFQHILHASRGG